MIVSLAPRIELALPAGWHELPPAAVLAAGDWVYEWVEHPSVPAERRGQLAHELTALGEFVRAIGSDDRVWMLVLHDDGSALRGLASLRMQDAASAADPELAEGFAAAPVVLDVVHLWARSTALDVVADFPATIEHDVLTIDYSSGPVVSERFVGTAFPDQGVAAVQLELTGYDLASFADIVATGREVLTALRVVDAD